MPVAVGTPRGSSSMVDGEVMVGSDDTEDEIYSVVAMKQRTKF